MSRGDLTLAALQAARRGWLVYPLRPRTKRPYFARVAHLATADPATITLWFDDVYRDAELGAIPPRRIVRVDVDHHDPAHDGEDCIARWRSAGLELPTSLECVTPRGGRHIYLRCHEAVTSHPLCPDGSVELKVGSVILPPSHGYRWVGYGDEPVADLPAWLLHAWHDERHRRWREHGRPPTVSDVNDLIDRIRTVTGEDPRIRSRFGSFRCPVHDDRHASAWLRRDPPIMVGCSAGCSPAAILEALGAKR